MLIANKIDYDTNLHKISAEQGQELANEFNIKFYQTSAKLNTNVTEAFLSK